MIVSIALLVAAQVELSWPALACPARSEVLAFLDAQLAGGAARAVRVSTSTAAGDRLELAIELDGRTIARTVELAGPCDRRAATVAAVIERVVSTAPLRVAIFEAPSVSVTATRAATFTKEGWIGAGVQGAAGSNGELGFGLGVEAGWWMRESIAIGGGASWRAPVIEGVVRIDEARADAFGMWRLEEHVALEARAVLQLAWAASRGISDPRTAFRSNPAIAFGLRGRFDLGAIGVDAGLRAFIPLTSQRFLVNDVEIARLPRLQLEAEISVFFAI